MLYHIVESAPVQQTIPYFSRCCYCWCWCCCTSSKYVPFQWLFCDSILVKSICHFYIYQQLFLFSIPQQQLKLLSSDAVEVMQLLWFKLKCINLDIENRLFVTWCWLHYIFILNCYCKCNKELFFKWKLKMHYFHEMQFGSKYEYT